jgi:excisionase family DNA binding protein
MLDRVETKMNCSAIPVSEACTRIGISRSKLYELLNEGEVPSVKIGRRRLIRVADLDRWLEALPSQTPGEVA